MFSTMIYTWGGGPQGTNSDIESDIDQINPRKSKASFSGGAPDVESRSSFAAGDPSTLPPSKKSKLIFDLNE